MATMAVETREESARPSLPARVRAFYDELKQELRQVIWPDRDTVYQTGIVVIFCVVFYGVYLFAADNVLGFTLRATLERLLARVFGA